MDTVSILKLGGILSAFKLLLLETYRSTDFEVHRNWLAITHSKNYSEWYFEDTSQWTLDYPPLFAYFECILSHIAKYFDKSMLLISTEPYESTRTVLFQRLSVVITDWLYIYAAQRLSTSLTKSVPISTENWKSHVALAMLLLLTTNCGLFIVDHIHFQYNGFLFGLLLLSIVNMMTNHPLWGAFWFTSLLCFKHIYLYLAPAFAIYLLRSYLFTNYNKDGKVMLLSFSIPRAILLALVKLPVYAAAFGPFIYMNQMPQVLARLFPFKRGLSHAYWAPNFWALYNFADKVLVIFAQKFGIEEDLLKGSMTGGLVQEYEHAILPSVTPLMTLVLTAASMLPAVISIWRHGAGPRDFLRCLTICGFCSYMFGWHVHEKAILMIIIPMTISAALNRKDAQVMLFLAPVGHFSLFPLIFTTKELPIVLCAFLIHTILVFVFLKSIHRLPTHLCSPLSILETLYLLLLPVVYVYWLFVHKYLGLEERLPFLPLMIISVYCAVGVSYSWVRYYLLCLSGGRSSRMTPRKKDS